MYLALGLSAPAIIDVCAMIKMFGGNGCWKASTAMTLAHALSSAVPMFLFSALIQISRTALQLYRCSVARFLPIHWLGIRDAIATFVTWGILRA